MARIKKKPCFVNEIFVNAINVLNKEMFLVNRKKKNRNGIEYPTSEK